MREHRSELESSDRIYAGLRLLLLATGALYALVALEGEKRARVFVAIGAFALYTAAFSAAALRRPDRKLFIYGLLGVFDLALVVTVMAVTGGAQSPFGRALYVWVSTLAFVFGRRTGLAASVAALGVFAVLHALERFPGDRWALVAQATSMLLHGPLIGYLADRERARTEALRVAHERLAALNKRVVDEQSRLIQTEKLSSLGLLAAGVAHEINNPLAGVLGCVKALRTQRLDDARRDEYFETVLDGLERIRTTVRGLLDYARQRPPTLTEVDVADIATACSRLIAPAARAKDVTVSIHATSGDALVRADRSQLMQAVVNVLMNAIYAAPRGGEVTIAAARDEGRSGIRIHDEGPGIPREILDRVCDPFFTTKPEGEGTGLGLAVTLGVVRANGGDLEIQSEPGDTEVTIWLPAVERVVACA